MTREQAAEMLTLTFAVNPAPPYTRVWLETITTAARNALEGARVMYRIASVTVTLDVELVDDIDEEKREMLRLELGQALAEREGEAERE